MKPTSAGRHGPLLPRKAFDLLPDIVRFVDPSQMFEDQLHAVAVRIDPCFQEGSGACRRQVRIVWQPLIPLGAATTTFDAAVHTFYEFSDNEWSELLKTWPRVKSNQTRASTLGVHALLRAEGFEGPYWQRLRNAILENCGERNLVRISAMTLNGPLMWNFMGFDLPTEKRVAIPRLPVRSRFVQSFIMDMESLVRLREFTATVAPAPVGEDLWTGFLADSKLFLESHGENDVKTIAELALTIENPTRHNPGTVDCISCHVAATARLWSETAFPSWDWVQGFSAVRFEDVRRIQNEAPPRLQTNRLRSFGYFETEAVVSSRVVNETSLVLDMLKAPL